MHLKYQLEHGMKNFNQLMDHILYQMFNIILVIYQKSIGRTVNSLRQIYINKIENRITFKIKIGYYIELLTPKAMKLVETTKIEIKKLQKC